MKLSQDIFFLWVFPEKKHKFIKTVVKRDRVRERDRESARVREKA